MKKNRHIGSSFASLMEEMGIAEEVSALAHKKMIAAQIEETMKKRKITKANLARMMRTSRTVISRLLDPADAGITLATLAKVSKALGIGLRVDFVT